jgi:hypothetical protein
MINVCGEIPVAVTSCPTINVDVLEIDNIADPELVCADVVFVIAGM